VVISQAVRDEIEAENAKFPRPRGGLLAALHRVQRECGAIGTAQAAELAEIFEMRAIEVLEVVSFYNYFSTKERGRHHVRVCTNLSCSLLGARELLRQIELHLGIATGGTTADGRIDLGFEECLGACASAPVMRIDDDYFEDLDLERARSVLDALE